MTYRSQEILFGVVGLLTGTLLMIHTFDPIYDDLAQDISLGPMFFPRILFFLWLICSAGITYEAIRKENKVVPFLWLRVAAAFITLLFFAAAINFLGFLTVGTICFFALSWIIGYRHPGKLAAIAVGYVLFVDLLFRYALQCYLPSSQIYLNLVGG